MMMRPALFIFLASQTVLSAFAATPFSPASGVVCFTPGDDCAGMIASEINRAQRQILVQAYSFTNRRIGDALVQAKRRGVDVQVIVDRSELAGRGDTQAAYLAANVIEVTVDGPPDGIAHNKVIVIDQGEVITGSFNFTEAAQRRNAENALIIGSPVLASAYAENWRRRRFVSQLLTQGN